MQLLSRLVKKGLNLQTHTPVTSVSEQPDSQGRWTVTTDLGTVLAKKVVFATNGYTSAIAKQFHEKIVPVLGICTRIVAQDQTKTQHLKNTYSLRFGKSKYDYMIARLDGSIVIGGAKTEFWDEPEHWYGISDDSKLIEPAVGYFDGLMQRHFAGWEDSGAYTEQIWTGIQGWTTDLMPYVGEVPSKPGQFIIAGFNGHGE
jgi:glycine/D-amino acid oxidase-like deaminating enzyme